MSATMQWERPARIAVVASVLWLFGCTPPGQYLANGFKVGPKYCRPAAPVEEHWIDAADKRVRNDLQIPCRWWRVFDDATLNRLVATAYAQNLSLRQAGFRVLEVRAQLGIVQGNVFPQTQDAFGSYRRQATAGPSSGS